MDNQQLNEEKSKQTAILQTPYKIMTTKASDQYDVDQTKIIENLLETKYNYSLSKTEVYKMEEVLGKLGKIIKQWSYNVAIKENIPEKEAFMIEAKLFTFGSYRLNVNQSGSDIDIICVVPKIFQRDKHFFGDLVEMLKPSNNPKVNECIALTNAKVPIIKMIYDGVPIDISFAQLDMQTIDEDLDLSDNNLLINLDEQSLKSLNGRRVADMILKSVTNTENFRHQIVFKFQEQHQDVLNYGQFKNVYHQMSQGKIPIWYLGGVSWAILVAKICQMYPNYQPNKLILRFFQIYSQWDWNMQVQIEEIIDEPNNPKNIEQWTGKAKDIGNYKMFVITPAFPCMNSSHMVTQTSLNILKGLFKESYELLNNGKKNRNFDWTQLFQRFDFFKTYDQFIQIDILGKEDQDVYKLWSGYVESRIRKLGIFFEMSSKYQKNPNLYELTEYFQFHLHPIGIELYDENYKFSKSYFYGIKLKDDQIKLGSQFDFAGPVRYFIQKNFTDDKIFKRNVEESDLRIFQISQKELPNSIYIQEQEKTNKKYRQEQLDDKFDDNEENFDKNIELPVKKKVHIDEQPQYIIDDNINNIINDEDYLAGL